MQYGDLKLDQEGLFAVVLIALIGSWVIGEIMRNVTIWIRGYPVITAKNDDETED